MPAEGKYQLESLFAGPLLKALEEKDSPVQTPVHWAEPDSLKESLEDPPVWTVKLNVNPKDPALQAEKEKIKAEQNERTSQIEEMKGKRVFQSVTDVLGVDKEKKERQERFWEESEPTSPWGGKDLGTFTHLLLEKAWDWKPELIPQAVEYYRGIKGFSKEQIAEVTNWMRQTLTNPLIQRARRAEKSFRELPLVGTEESSFLNAKLDLAFLEDRKWVIVDYKTDRDPNKLAEKYGKQLKHYAKLLEQTTPYPVKEAHLIFIRENRTQAVPL